MIKNNSLISLIFKIFLIILLPFSSSASPVIINILDYGAKGDGILINTKSIQSAIDACSMAGGGTVSIPAGRYVTGTVFLKSYINLSLEAGAVLVGSKNIVDYPVTVSAIRSFTDNYVNKSLIYGEGLEHISITGLGAINGNGASFILTDDSLKNRPYLMRIINCKNVLVRDITLLNSPMWVQHYLACENVNIDGITVRSRVNHNNDGLDIDGCNDVRVSNCEIISGDDGIVLKSTLDRPCQNVAVTNCIISSNCSAFKLGTETNGGFQNITFSNSTIYNTLLAGITLQLVDGGTLDRVSVSNITMDNVGTAIFIRLGNRGRTFLEKMAKPGIGKLSNVIISGVLATNVGETGCSISGLPAYPVSNITLENIRIFFKGGGKQELVNREIPEIPEVYPEFDMFGNLPAYGFYCRHAENVTFNKVEMHFIKPDERPAIVCDDINHFEFSRIKAMFSGNEPMIFLRNAKNVWIQACIAPVGIKTFLEVSGAKSEHITLMGNDLSGTEKVVNKNDDIDVFSDYNRLK